MTKNNIFIIYFKRVIKKVNKYTEDKKRKKRIKQIRKSLHVMSPFTVKIFKRNKIKNYNYIIIS